MKLYLVAFNDMSILLWLLKTSVYVQFDLTAFMVEKEHFLEKCKQINLIAFSESDKFAYYRICILSFIIYGEHKKAVEMAKEAFNVFLKSRSYYSFVLINLVKDYLYLGCTQEETAYYQKWISDFDKNEIGDIDEEDDALSLSDYMTIEPKVKEALMQDDLEKAKKLIEKTKQYLKCLYIDSNQVMHKKPLTLWKDLVNCAVLYCEKVNSTKELRDLFYYFEDFIKDEEDIDSYLFSLVGVYQFMRPLFRGYNDVFKDLHVETARYILNIIYSNFNKCKKVDTASLCFVVVCEENELLDLTLDEKLRGFYASCSLLLLIGVSYHLNPCADTYLNNVFSLANHFYKLGNEGKKEVSKILKEYIETYHLIRITKRDEEIAYNCDRELCYLLAIAYLIDTENDSRAFRLYYTDIVPLTKSYSISILINNSDFFMKELKDIGSFRIDLYSSVLHMELLSLSSSCSPFELIAYVTDDYLNEHLFVEVELFHNKVFNLLNDEDTKRWQSTYPTDFPLCLDLIAKYFLYDCVINNVGEERMKIALDFYNKHKYDWDTLTADEFYGKKAYILNDYNSRSIYEEELRKTTKGCEILKLVAQNESRKWKRFILHLSEYTSNLGLRRVIQGYFESINAFNDDYEIFIQELVKYTCILETLIDMLKENEELKDAPLVYYGIYAPLLVNQYAYKEKYSDALEYGNYVLSYIKGKDITINEMLYENMAVSCMKLNRSKDETAFYLKEAVKHHSYYSKKYLGKTPQNKQNLIKILNTLRDYEPENKDYYWHKVSILIESNNPNDVSEKITAYNYLIRFEALHSNYSEALSLATEKLAFLNQKYNLDDIKEEFINTYQQLSDVYKQLGDEDKSYEYYLLAQKLINNEE